MKLILLSIVMLASAAVYAEAGCGGDRNPCPSNGPQWDGTYAPGYSANTGSDIPVTFCGGDRTPCASKGPDYTGCPEGRVVNTWWFTGQYTQKKHQEIFEPVQAICHNNDWIPLP